MAHISEVLIPGLSSPTESVVYLSLVKVAGHHQAPESEIDERRHALIERGGGSSEERVPGRRLASPHS
jgi:hypothetical protein